jgi:hypothetical protein
MCVSNTCEDRRSQTCSCPILVFRPDVVDGCTLEEKEEEVHRAEDYDYRKGGIYDDSLIFSDGKSEEVRRD